MGVTNASGQYYMDALAKLCSGVSVKHCIFTDNIFYAFYFQPY